jgi:hypothetical protein
MLDTMKVLKEWEVKIKFLRNHVHTGRPLGRSSERHQNFILGESSTQSYIYAR